MTSSADLAALADSYLPPDVAGQWKRLFRPATRLETAGIGDVVAAQLGGDPELPEDEPWPRWPGHGPLHFVLSLDCARIGLPDFPLPESGRLLFFYDMSGKAAGTFAAGAREGARVLYIPEGTSSRRRSAPRDLSPFNRWPLRAVPIVTAPDLDCARMDAVFGDYIDRLNSDHPINDPEFASAYHGALPPVPMHQVGGHSLGVQGPVEFATVADAKDIQGALEWAEDTDPDQWLLLAQIDTDTDAEMVWGDAGCLYWVIQKHDLAERRFERAVVTMQWG